MKQNFLFNNYLLTRLTHTEMIKQFTAKGLDFKPEHFLILALLDHYKQMRQKDIAHGTIKSKATITRAITKLVPVPAPGEILLLALALPGTGWLNVMQHIF